ncbi:MAG: ATP phosphoribosyltransferase [Pseudomonadota bacterium]
MSGQREMSPRPGFQQGADSSGTTLDPIEQWTAEWSAAATREGGALAEIDALQDRLADFFAGAGYRPVAPPHLYPAELLLDLYGEDLHGRAYLFPAAGGADALCLRPDFTVPVALAHGGRGWDRPAKYAYRGPVFRRQEAGSTRPVEYLQAGIESIGAADPAEAEAEILSLTLEGLDALGAVGLDVVTGDLGIVFALLEALRIPAALHAALCRHLWRPARFQALLDEARRAKPAPSSARAALIAAAAGGPAALAEHLARAGEIIGLREMTEIEERIAAFDADARAAALEAEQAELITTVLRTTGATGDVLSALRSLTIGAGLDLTAALDRLERRLDAMTRIGLDAEGLFFDAGFGRTLEYYDGFVFEVRAANRPSLPPLAGGGRYDGLTQRLGASSPIPAIGAMIRPEAAMAARAQSPAAATGVELPGAGTGAGTGTGGTGAPDAVPSAATPALMVRRRRAIPSGDLVLALPSKGRLQADTIDWFASRGVAIRRTGEGREYAAEAEGAPGLGVAMLSAGEIPAALEQGQVHLGVTGQDLVQEEITDWTRRVRLAARMGFGHADLICAVPAWWADVESVADLDDAAERFRRRHGHALRIATKYHTLTRRFFRERGVADYRLIDSQGATEAAPKNHAAEALVDITSSGRTLEANHLRVLEDGVMLKSQACLFLSRGARWTPVALQAAERLAACLSVDLRP